MSKDFDEEEGLQLKNNFGFFLTDYFMPMYQKLKNTWEKVTEDEIVEHAGEFALEQWTEDGNHAFSDRALDGRR